MAAVTVTLSNQVLIAQVAMRASFEGRSARDTDGSSLYDTVRVTEQDHPLLESFIADARDNLVAQYPDLATINTGNVVYTIESSVWDTNLETAVQAQSIGFIVNYCCRRWFELRLPAVVQSYQDRAALCILNLNTILYSRKAPVKGDGTGLSGLVNITTPQN